MILGMAFMNGLGLNSSQTSRTAAKTKDLDESLTKIAKEDTDYLDNYAGHNNLDDVTAEVIENINNFLDNGSEEVGLKHLCLKIFTDNFIFHFLLLLPVE